MFGVSLKYEEFYVESSSQPFIVSNRIKQNTQLTLVLLATVSLTVHDKYWIMFAKKFFFHIFHPQEMKLDFSMMLALAYRNTVPL